MYREEDRERKNEKRRRKRKRQGWKGGRGGTGRTSIIKIHSQITPGNKSAATSRPQSQKLDEEEGVEEETDLRRSLLGPACAIGTSTR